MPPKPKFTREDVAQAALAIIKSGGVEALTARTLAAWLGSSPRPIFTLFKSMDEVKWAARELALKEFEVYTGDFDQYTPAFKRIGMMMVSYAIHEPELYKLLFMQEHARRRSFGETMAELGGMAERCTTLIRRDYGLSEEDARALFEQMWVHAFGLGALCAMKVCDFTEEETARRLGQVFAGSLTVIKAGGAPEFSIRPVKNAPDETP